LKSEHTESVSSLNGVGRGKRNSSRGGQCQKYFIPRDEAPNKKVLRKRVGGGKGRAGGNGKGGERGRRDKRRNSQRGGCDARGPNENTRGERRVRGRKEKLRVPSRRQTEE